MASYTDTPPSLWTAEQAAQWMELAVQFPQYKENMIKHAVTGEKLLSLTLRDFDKIGIQNIMHGRKIEYNIHKLKEEDKKRKEEEENSVREALVMQKMTTISQIIEDGQQQKQDASKSEPTPMEIDSTITQPNSDTQKSGPVGTVADSAHVKNWSQQQVLVWIDSLGLSEYKDNFTKLGVDGAKLLSLGAAQLVQQLGVTQIPHRRKLELAISRLKEAIEQAQKEEEEKTKRLDEGFESIDPVRDSQPSASMKYLSEGIYLHKTKLRSEYTFEVDNNLSEQQTPFCLELTLSDTQNVNMSKIVSPFVKVFLPLNEKVRRHVIDITPIDANQPWSFKFKCTQRTATLDDYLLSQDCETKLKMKAQAVPGLKESGNSFTDAMMACKRSGRKFTDPEFAPLLTSLYIDMEDLKEKDKTPVTWKRPEDFFSSTAKPTLFAGRIDPSDIQQGRLGDCWFLGALSVIAARPELVLKLMVTTEINPQGVYCVQFHRGEEWVQVVVDDYLPCLAKTGYAPFDIEIFQKVLPSGSLLYGPIFTHSAQNDLWVCLLEKGYAKLNKSYQALTAGTLEESLYDLTGAPCISYFLGIEEPNEVWKKLLSDKQNGFLMGCATRHLTIDEKASGFNLKQYGLVNNHAYGLLDVREVRGHKLLRLRNPWGYFSWLGDWSDESSRWTDELKQLVNFKSEPGAFWICWEDFLKHFGDIAVCKIGEIDGWAKTRIDGVYSNETPHGAQMNIRVQTATKVYITLSKKDLRFSCGADVDNRHGLYMLERNKTASSHLDRFIFVASTGDAGKREVTLEVTLEPGKDYLLVVSARIGTVKFESVEWNMTFLSNSPIETLQIERIPAHSMSDLSLAIILYMKAYQDKKDLIDRSLYALMHYAFYKENRMIIAENGGIPFLKQVISQYMDDKSLVKEAINLAWNLGCDLGVRQELNKHDFKSLFMVVKERHYSNTEIQELADIAYRNLTLTQGFAMDPLIEKCIIANACTFSVTGDKTYLSQSWHDCYTCNLRCRYGICSVCVETCHKGHKISPPKFAVSSVIALTEGPVLECSFCPNVFHLNCLPKGTKISRPRWGCPSHRCAACGAQTSTSRGKIYRCITCPSAYCFDHAPANTKTVKLNPYEALGYTTKSFVFVQCGECMKDKTIQADLFTETPLELELRFKSKSSAGTGSSAAHRKRSNSFSDDDEYEIEYPRKKQRTSPVASPVESVVASTRRKVKSEVESNGHTHTKQRTYDAFQPDQKTYMQPQRPGYQSQQYVDTQQVPLVPSYYSGGNDYSFFRPSFGVMYYQPQADNNYSNTQNGYQHHAYNTPSTLNHYSNGHTAQNGTAQYAHTNGTTRQQPNGTTAQYENMVKVQMPDFHSVPNVTAHSNQYFTNITSLNNPVTNNGSSATNTYSQQQSYTDYAQNQNNSTIDIYNIN